MKTIAWWVCGCIALLSGIAFADGYWAERQALDSEIGQAISAQDLSQALALIERGLTADEQNLGKEHPISLERLKAKLFIYRHLKQKELADATAERISTLWKTAFDTSSDPAILEVLGDYARSEGATEAAAAAFRKALAAREPEAKDPQSSLALASTLYHLADARFASNFERMDEECLGYVRKAIELREKIQGRDHHDLVPLLKLITQDRNQSVGMAEVENLHKRIIRIEESAHPASHNSVLRAHRELARFYLESKRYDAALAITQRYLGTPGDPAMLDSEFGLYTIAALLLQERTSEAAHLLYQSLSFHMQQAPKESYEQLFQGHLLLLENPLGKRHEFSPTAWDGLADEVYRLERNAAKGFPYLSFFLRQVSTGKLENKDARRYLDSLKKTAEISSSYLPTQDLLALGWMENSLDQVARHYPEKSETLARQMAIGHQRSGSLARSRDLLAAAEKYKQQASAMEARTDVFIDYLDN